MTTEERIEAETAEVWNNRPYNIRGRRIVTESQIRTLIAAKVKAEEELKSIGSACDKLRVESHKLRLKITTILVSSFCCECEGTGRFKITGTENQKCEACQGTGKTTFERTKNQVEVMKKQITTLREDTLREAGEVLKKERDCYARIATGWTYFDAAIKIILSLIETTKGKA